MFLKNRCPPLENLTASAAYPGLDPPNVPLSH